MAYLPRCDLGVVLVDAATTLNQEDLALLRALYGAGTPVMLLLSKADLLVPSDRERMAGYIREQIRRELELDLAVHPVSIVGADESLLTRWFDEDLEPLLEQHRALVDASLRRKTAHLGESVISTLETILVRRNGGRTKSGSVVDTAAASRVLDAADEAIRRARDRSLNWSDDRLVFAESIPSLISKAVMAARASAPVYDLAKMVEETLLRRGMAAYEVVATLQDVVAMTIEIAAAGFTARRRGRYIGSRLSCRRPARAEYRSVGGYVVGATAMVGGDRPHGSPHGRSSAASAEFRVGDQGSGPIPRPQLQVMAQDEHRTRCGTL